MKYAVSKELSKFSIWMWLLLVRVQYKKSVWINWFSESIRSLKIISQTSEQKVSNLKSSAILSEWCSWNLFLLMGGGGGRTGSSCPRIKTRPEASSFRPAGATTSAWAPSSPSRAARTSIRRWPSVLKASGCCFVCLFFFGCLIFHEDTLTPRTGSASTNSGAKRSPLGRPITTSCWWTSTNSSRPSGAKERRRLAFNAFSKRWPSQKSCLDLSPVVELNGPFLFVSFLFCVLVEDGGNCWRRASAKDWRTLRVGRPGASAWSRRRWPGPGTKSRARSSKSNDNCPVMS